MSVLYSLPSWMLVKIMMYLVQGDPFYMMGDGSKYRYACCTKLAEAQFVASLMTANGVLCFYPSFDRYSACHYHGEFRGVGLHHSLFHMYRSCCTRVTAVEVYEPESGLPATGVGIGQTSFPDIHFEFPELDSLSVSNVSFRILGCIQNIIYALRYVSIAPIRRPLAMGTLFQVLIERHRHLAKLPSTGSRVNWRTSWNV